MRKYEIPDMEVIKFMSSDVVTASGDDVLDWDDNGVPGVDFNS